MSHLTLVICIFAVALAPAASAGPEYCVYIDPDATIPVAVTPEYCHLPAESLIGVAPSGP